MSNMGVLFQEWKDAIDLESRNSSQTPLILTAGVQYSPNLDSASFPIDSIQQYLNWVHVIAYDFYMPTWSNFTRAQAALYDPSSTTNADYGIGTWINGGLSADNIVLWLPFYGYAWTLVNPANNSIGAPATGPAITKEGQMSFKEIKDYISRYGATVMYNATYVVNYCSIGTSWIGFDDVEVVKIKVSYAKKRNLLGYFVWQVSHDDNLVLSQAAAGRATKAMTLDTFLRGQYPTQGILKGLDPSHGIRIKSPLLIGYISWIWRATRAMVLDPFLRGQCLAQCIKVALLRSPI
ncbi:hypothetical protein LWI29_009804 [Acer saccharum]|uniref:GH18 domain-containing protein n=1 Tax=Acer saccharum TaxID=4024 RepID=A0AA39S6K0_ACESA|nr:hypothetical protein LWI29_009804 [Acer saccharum]